MLKLSQTILNCLKNNNRPLSVINYKCMKSTIAVEAKNPQSIFENDTEEDTLKPKLSNTNLKPQNRMVAAAFASLQPEYSDIKTPFTDDKIYKAESVNELLSISEGSGVSRRHALKVVSTLADWSSSGKAKLTDFENDARFIKLCRILTKGAKISRNSVSRSEDLSTVLNVTADDEAARLVANLTLPQTVKVFCTLSQKKRRSVSLLRSLAYNVTASSEQLDLKQSADLLYGMCILNFHDNNLLAKLCGDINNQLGSDLKRSAVVGSIITSLGLLKYKNCEVLDTLSDWILKNHSICRPQDIFSLFVTLATLNHTPTSAEQLYKILIPQLLESEAKKPLVWLNVVWSLVLLNQASTAHVSSVLSEEFVNKIEGNKSLNMFAKLKLLNVNGAANHLLKDYSGPKLSPLSSIHNVNIGKTKEKAEMVDAVIDTLKNLIQLENHLSTNINTDLGFFIDIKCLLDKKCNPLPIEGSNETRNDVKRVAILAFDYHDMCHGKIEPTGVNAFACKLLKAQGYSVLTVPYTEFKITDKLVYRVQYLETKLKDLVK